MSRFSRDNSPELWILDFPVAKKKKTKKRASSASRTAVGRKSTNKKKSATRRKVGRATTSKKKPAAKKKSSRSKPTKKSGKKKSGRGHRKKTLPKLPRLDAAEEERIGEILKILIQLYPDPECALHHDNPLQLLVATILSAQCTDERVNMVTPALFRKYRTAAEFAASPPGELEQDIRSTGFFNSKARNIRGACQRIEQQHGGLVPNTIEELVELPGVARKTANVVLGTAFGITAGVVVDTHVTRLSNLLQLTNQKDPVKIEKDLQLRIPRKEWINFSHRLIWHGRKVCIARRPQCGECRLQELCPSRLEE